MRITPLDIRKQPFQKTWRGFDPDAVNSFLEHVAKEYETIMLQNNEFATRVKSLEQQLESYTKIERVLNDTLMSAQRSSDEAKVNAQKEAELIIKDAQIRADRYHSDARHKVDMLENEIVAIRNQRDSFLARFKSMLSTQLSLLEVISGDLRKDDELLDNEGEDAGRAEQPAKRKPQTQRMPIVDTADDDMIDVPPQPMIIA